MAVPPIGKTSWTEDVEARIAALEAKVKAEGAKVNTWFKTLWPHLITWAGGVVMALKAFGKL
jgi:hypothetical protein